MSSVDASKQRLEDQKRKALIKYVSLVVLTAQNATYVLFLRWTRTHKTEKADLYYSSTVIVLAEVAKMLACVLIIACEYIWRTWGGSGENGFSIGGLCSQLHRDVLGNKLEVLKMAVPAGIYAIQNNLLFYALSNIDAATFQVLYQLKIITTALFSVTMLGKRLDVRQWAALLMLFVGVAVVQLEVQAAGAPKPMIKLNSNADVNLKMETPQPVQLQPLPAVADDGEAVENVLDTLTAVAQPLTMPNTNANTAQTPNAALLRPMGNVLLGCVAVLASAVSSGFAGVYFEKVLKDSKQSIWVRNIQLGFFGAVFSLAWVYSNDGAGVAAKGFLHGYSASTWAMVAMQALGGLIVAVVVVFADNIVKGFASSTAIVISCLLSVYVFSFVLTAPFVFGATLVVVAVFVYGVTWAQFSVAIGLSQPLPPPSNCPPATTTSAHTMSQSPNSHNARAEGGLETGERDAAKDKDKEKQ